MTSAPILIFGHETVTLTGAIQAVSAASSGVRTATLQAPSGNVGAIFLGGPAVTTSDYGYRIAAGESGPVIPDADLSKLYMVGTLNDKLFILKGVS